MCNIRQQRVEIISQYNDALRQTYWGGQVIMSVGVAILDDALTQRIFNAVRDFDNFTKDNDPHGEHDFGKITLDGQDFFWKIDYYDNHMRGHSPDPGNPDVTSRVLTIMKAEEY